MQTAASAVQHLSLVLIMKTVSCTTGVIDELAHGTAGRTSQAMYPENAQCASAFFYSSDGSLFPGGGTGEYFQNFESSFSTS